MKKIKKIIIIMLVIIFITAIIAISIALVKAINEPIDITDIQKSVSISSFSEKEEDVVLKWYETLDEALQDDELIRDENVGEIDYKMSDAVELLQIQNANSLAVFYTRVPKEGNIARIVCVLIEIKDGKFSQPYRIELVGSKPGYSNNSAEKSYYTYDCDDAIVFYIEQEMVIGRAFGNGQNQIPICFGMWDDENEIQSLTIAGQSPTIIPIVGDEDTRYFWYYENIDWLDKLEVIDWNNYTYGQIIDLLEIKYNKSDN